MSENFLDWEQEYKNKKILLIREQLIIEVKDEYEFKLQEMIELEKNKMEE